MKILRVGSPRPGTLGLSHLHVLNDGYESVSLRYVLKSTIVVALLAVAPRPATTKLL